MLEKATSSAELAAAAFEDAQVRRARSEWRTLWVVALTAFLATWFIGLAMIGGQVQPVWSGYTTLAFGTVVPLVLIITGRLRSDARQFEAVRDRTKAVLDAAGSGPKYFDELVNINVGNLQNYYRLVGVQASRSFFASLFVGLSGFAFVLAALVAALSRQDQLVTVIAASSGIVTEFISTVFFYLYSRTVRQLKEYHESLIKVQNVLLAFRIVETTTDPDTKAAMSRDMLRYLVPAGVQGNGLVAASTGNESLPVV